MIHYRELQMNRFGHFEIEIHSQIKQDLQLDSPHLKLKLCLDTKSGLTCSIFCGSQIERESNTTNNQISKKFVT